MPEGHYTSSLTWMIVEDDRVIREVLLAMCQLWDFPALAFKDGRQALDYLKQVPLPAPVPDVALIDIRIPGPWGHQVAARLREHPQIGSIPIILMTGYELEASDVEQYLAESGADLIVYKPLPPMEELLKIVDQLNQPRQRNTR
ncbi:MAG: hypothetical protein Kow00124_21990 [Anaerolineae bacterium]